MSNGTYLYLIMCLRDRMHVSDELDKTRLGPGHSTPGTEEHKRGQHVLYLATHGEEEEGEEVYNKDGPVHRDVERLEERAEQRDDGSAC